MSNILVTGGNGFIGSHLVDALAKEKSNHVTVLDLYPRTHETLPANATFVQGDLSDSGLVRHTLEDRAITLVYHLAWSTIHETALKNPTDDIQRNVIPSIQLFEACCAVDIQQVIFLSSGGTIYGIPQHLPIGEDHPTHPINAYGVSKLTVESYLQMYTHLHELQSMILRASVPYGPRQNPLRRQGAVAVFVYRALRHEPITIWGDGQTLRDYLYIDDMVQALLMARNYPATGTSILNIGGARVYSLNELVQVIEQTLGVTMQVRYEPPRNFDVQQLDLDTSAASRALCWRPVVSLDEGVKRLATWMQAQDL